MNNEALKEARQALEAQKAVLKDIEFQIWQTRKEYNKACEEGRSADVLRAKNDIRKLCLIQAEERNTANDLEWEWIMLGGQY